MAALRHQFYSVRIENGAAAPAFKASGWGALVRAKAQSASDILLRSLRAKVAVFLAFEPIGQGLREI